MWKKIFSITILSIFLALPVFILADVCDQCEAVRDCGDKATWECVGGFCQKKGTLTLCPPTRHTNFEELITDITKFIFYVALALAPIMALIGGFFILTSSGDPQKMDKGRKVLIWTGIGLLIILFAYGILSVIKQLLA